MPETREETILRWLPLAWKGCRRFRKSGILLDDLRQEAVVGLILAVDAFDPTKGAFLPYAAKTINHHLLSMCAAQIRPYRIPNYLNSWVLKVRKAVVALSLRAIYNPSPFLISEQSGLSLKQVAKVLSVDWCRVPSNNLCAPEAVDPIDVRELLAPLSLDEQDLLAQRFGLLGQSRQTLNNLAKADGVTRECIRKRQEKALAKALDGATA